MKSTKDMLEQIKTILRIILFVQIVTFLGLAIGFGVIDGVLFIVTVLTFIAYIYYYNLDITKKIK